MIYCDKISLDDMAAALFSLVAKKIDVK